MKNKFSQAYDDFLVKAKGDGVTDDTQAFQDLLNAISQKDLSEDMPFYLLLVSIGFLLGVLFMRLT